MKQYVIDELRYTDYEKIKDYFDKNFKSAGVDGIYWIMLDKNILAGLQCEHIECQPFYFAVELTTKQATFELLLRSKNKMRCSCVNYATEFQRNWLINIVDAMLAKLEIKI